ncbi:MAG: DUF1343 domain-containing protein [Bacteroidota bacterium]
MKPLLLFSCLCLSLIVGATPLIPQDTSHAKQVNYDTLPVMTGADQLETYLPLLKGKKVALIVNQTSIVGNYHTLLDTLLHRKVIIKKVFVPEHGLRGMEDAGATIKNGKDKATGIDVFSLYGKNKKPSKEQLSNVDVLIYDLQDVGARFYTYISTLQYAMEACAEFGKELLILDRPNPNGFYIDGPVLDTSLRSFVGMQPIPIVYAMTAGEYAQMLKGEKWFPGAEKLKLNVIPCVNYDHSIRYHLPVQPSPNLKTMTAVYLYPSLCLFEGTVVSVGRGTDVPFQVWGHPDFYGHGFYNFLPKSVPGAESPLHMNRTCYGQVAAMDSSEASFILKNKVRTFWLSRGYEWYPYKEKYFNSFFEKLCGNKELREQIEKGVSEEDIRKGWQKDLNNFKQIRKKYLLYKDFE